MLELRNVSFLVDDAGKDKEIIRDVSLTVPDRKLVVVTGPNGGGKSTLARLIAGIEKPTEGRVFFNGEDITDLGITERAQKGIAYAFQQPVRFKGIRVLDLIRIASGKTLSVSDACEYLSSVGLCARDYVDREVNASLSGGELKRIEIATVLARRAVLSVFDEPEAGIDLWSFRNLTEVFQRMREDIRDSSILIISHQERILNIADEIIVIKGGVVEKQGSRDEVYPHLMRNEVAALCEGPYVPAGKGGRGMLKLDEIQKRLLREVADLHEVPEGAYNIRSNSASAGRQSTANIEIVSKEDVSGLEIRIKPGTKNESVHIPVVMTQSGLKEVVYNDFFIGEGADVVIIAGCGIDNCGNQDSQHDGIHRFYVGKNARIRYVEKHYGSGTGSGKRILNPGTEVYMEEGSYAEMEMVQIKGVDDTERTTTAELAAGAKLVVRERLMTHGDQRAISTYVVNLNGEGSSADVVSRSVARDRSFQKFDAKIAGNAACHGHTECDSIIMDEGRILAVPALEANNVDAELVHEAAIGKIAGEQLTKLMTLGLTAAEAEEQIINGFLQ